MDSFTMEVLKYYVYLEDYGSPLAEGLAGLLGDLSRVVGPELRGLVGKVLAGSKGLVEAEALCRGVPVRRAPVTARILLEARGLDRRCKVVEEVTGDDGKALIEAPYTSRIRVEAPELRRSAEVYVDMDRVRVVLKSSSLLLYLKNAIRRFTSR